MTEEILSKKGAKILKQYINIGNKLGINHDNIKFNPLAMFMDDKHTKTYKKNLNYGEIVDKIDDYLSKEYKSIEVKIEVKDGKIEEHKKIDSLIMIKTTNPETETASFKFECNNSFYNYNYALFRIKISDEEYKYTRGGPKASKMPMKAQKSAILSYTELKIMIKIYLLVSEIKFKDFIISNDSMIITFKNLNKFLDEINWSRRCRTPFFMNFLFTKANELNDFYFNKDNNINDFDLKLFECFVLSKTFESDLYNHCKCKTKTSSIFNEV